ncbi:hypothetical protein NDO75_27410 [Natrinema sp. 1APR25-10V2]|nr:hypothetical protein [Natrinema sp. 1APR25-10V2]
MRVQPAIHEFIDALEEGEGEREAYRKMISRFVEMATVGFEDLEDLGVYNRDCTEDFLLVRAIDVMGCIADGREDLAPGYVQDVDEAIDELAEEDNHE